MYFVVACESEIPEGMYTNLQMYLIEIFKKHMDMIERTGPEPVKFLYPYPMPENAIRIKAIKGFKCEFICIGEAGCPVVKMGLHDYVLFMQKHGIAIEFYEYMMPVFREGVDFYVD